MTPRDEERRTTGYVVALWVGAILLVAILLVGGVESQPATITVTVTPSTLSAP